MEDNQEAWNSLVSSPLWGIGSTKVHWEASNIFSGGQDVHPLLMQGLLAGFPGLLLLMMWFVILGRRLASILRVGLTGLPSARALSAAVALAVALFLSAVNTTPAFLFGVSQIPFGIFCGVLLTKQKLSQRTPRLSHSGEVIN